MFSILCLTEFRVFNKTGQLEFLKHQNGSNFSAFLDSNDYSIVFFADNTSNLDFSIPAIQRFSNEIGFVIVPIREAIPKMCSTFPCIIPFHKRKPLFFPDPKRTESNFLNWVKQIKNPNIYRISSSDELTTIFQSQDPSFLIIDSPIPKNYPTNIQIYLVPLRLLELYSSNSSIFQKGLFIFRPSDRQLIPYSGSLIHDLKTSIILDSSLLQSLKLFKSFKDIKTQKQKFCAVFFQPFFHNLTEASSINIQNEYIIFDQLSKQFNDLIIFSIISDKFTKKFQRKLRLFGFSPPFFAVFDINNYYNKRWIISDLNYMHNISYLQIFLKNITKNLLPPLFLSETPSPQPFQYYYNSKNNNEENNLTSYNKNNKNIKNIKNIKNLQNNKNEKKNKNKNIKNNKNVKNIKNIKNSKKNKNVKNNKNSKKIKNTKNIFKNIRELEKEESKLHLQFKVEQIFGINFKEKVFIDNYDSMVLILSEKNENEDNKKLQLKSLAIANSVQKLFDEYDIHIKIFWINGAKNDLPKNTPKIKGFPTILFWQAGFKEKKPLIFNTSVSFDNFVSFIIQSSSHNLTKPLFSPDLIQAEISDYIDILSNK